MTQYPLWLQSDITAASDPEGWQERREKTLAALKKITDTARTDPLTEVAYGLAVQLALMDDEAAEMRRKVRALDDQVFFTRARVDGLWEDLKEMRDGTPAEEGDDDALLERLAALEHDRWAHGTNHMLNYLDGRYGFSKDDEVVLRWRRQTLAHYADLSEHEKDSDRVWARAIREIVAEYRSFDTVEEFKTLWKRYVLEDPEKLTGEALALRERLIDTVKELGKPMVDAKIRSILDREGVSNRRNGAMPPEKS